MAIKKSKELPNGASGEYWKIISIEVDRSSMELKAIIALFKDRSKAIAKQPLGSQKLYKFSITSQQSHDNLIELAYEKIKAKAASQVTHDVMGHACDAHDFDSDLSNGEDV